MSLAYYYDPLFSISDFNSLFDDAFAARSNAGQQVSRRNENSLWKPRMDLHESPESNQVTATFELPGMTKDNVNIDVHRDRLTVSGEVTHRTEKKEEGGWVVTERRDGKFSRTLPLPSGTKPEEVEAKVDNGVLIVTFPKSHPDMAPKKIAIN